MKENSLRKLKQRLKFFDNFQKITKTVFLISSVKYRRYYQQIADVISTVFYLGSTFKEILHRYPEVKSYLPPDFNIKGKKSLIIPIVSDRGLAGSFDLVIIQRSEKLINRLKEKGREVVIGVIGKKGKNYFSKKYQLLFSFDNLESLQAKNFTEELISYLRFLIKKGEVREIFFVQPVLASGTYRVEITKVFPIIFKSIDHFIKRIIYQTKFLEKLSSLRKNEESPNLFFYILEPSPQELVKVIFENVWYSFIYIIVLHSLASLEIARTITMKRAEEKAKELKSEALLKYNKIRQTKITQEILDIARSF